MISPAEGNNSQRLRRRSVSGALFVSAALCLQRGSLCSAAASACAAAFAPPSVRGPNVRPNSTPTTTTTTTTTLDAWFGGGNAKQQDEKESKASTAGGVDASSGRPYPSKSLLGGGGGGDDDGGQMGRTASTLEAFKASQEVGKRTAQVMNELSGMTIEGVGPLGIKAYVDGRGRPTGIKMDDSLLGRAEGAVTAVSAEDVQDAITKAFQVAYDKSLEQQEEKMMPLYSDLGLSTS